MTLKRQVADGRLSHAYLFTGTRGTGKTTCAKILAKAVNCESPQNGDPCNRCPACLGIDSGTFLDVTEMDAASNNGVDNIRSLRDEAVYSPAQVKKRVYIVDEVHMLSTQAFNALLKILEEPPEHLIFILATTELHKVPATILSRCQRFSFRRIQPVQIERRLNDVAKAERIDLRPDGAELLARLADGALRDALSLLDQCAAAGGVVDAAEVLDTLGLAGNLQSAQLLGYILARDSKSALLLFDQLYAGGKDVGAVLSSLSALSRDLLICLTAPEGGQSLLSGGYDSNTLQSLLSAVSSARLIQLCTILQETAAALQSSVNRRIDAELCLLRLCDESLSGDLTALNARMTRLEEQFSAGLAFAASPAARTAAPTTNTARVPASDAAVPAGGEAGADAGAAPESASAEERSRPSAEDLPIRQPPDQAADSSPAPENPVSDDLPPWEEERPPLPDDTDAPPAQDEAYAVPVRDDAYAAPVRESAPAAARQPSAPQPEPPQPSAEQGAPAPATDVSAQSDAPASTAAVAQSAAAPGGTSAQDAPASDGAVFKKLMESYLNRLPVHLRGFLRMASGRISEDVLTIYCGNEPQKNMLDKPDVTSVLAEVTSQSVGRDISVRFAIGEPAGEPHDKMQDLLQKSSSFSNFRIK